MQKVYGSPVRQDGLYKIGRNKWELIYGFGKDHEDDETGWNYRKTFDHKPTWEEVRNVLIDIINKNTQTDIVEGFVWQGERVWLSEDNQRNYLMIEKLPESNYPLSMKFNETEAGEALYHVFLSKEDFMTFSKAASQYVIDRLAQGWAEKDSITPSTYGF